MLKKIVYVINNYYHLQVTVVVLLFALACNKKSSRNSTATSSKQVNLGSYTVNSEIDNTIEFTIDGSSNKVVTNCWGTSIAKARGSTWLQVMSNMHKDKRTISLKITTFSVGKILIEDLSPDKDFTGLNHTSGSFYPDFMKGESTIDPYVFKSGEIIISAIDTLAGYFSATFSGIASNKAGEKVIVSNGKITNAKIQKERVDLSISKKH